MPTKPPDGPTGPSLLPGDPFRDRPAGAVLVGFSGGLDSTVLLHALATTLPAQPGRLRAIHVHHGLQAEADQWANHCARVCKSLGIPLEIDRVSVDPVGTGPEAAARDARHAAFAERLPDGGALATAHHRDDQAETFLLRALRGSGPDGLASMRRWRPFAAGQLWRPLLDLPRSALLEYALAHGLEWIEDPSNIDCGFDRNFLRQQVFPLLQSRWPEATAAFARAATLCGDGAGVLAEQDQADLLRVSSDSPERLSCPALRQLPPARRARVLRRWIQSLGLPPLPAHGVASVESDLLHARPDASGVFRWGSAAIHAWRGELHALADRPPWPADWQVDWDGSKPLTLPDGGMLTLVGATSLPERCRVTARRGGERIRLPGRGHSHRVKHLLQDLGVPPWLRQRLPLLVARDGRTLAVADLARDAGLQDWLDGQHAHLQWSRNPPQASN